MDALGSLDRFVFEGFRFDLAAGGLFRTNGSGVTEPVILGSRALALLALLVERSGQLVSKEDIFATAWSGTVVGENNLTVQISTLRRVLDRDRTQGSCIQTISGRGYRFIPAVTRVEADNIFGDGAHIAPQLEGSAAPGGGAVANPDKPSIAVPPFSNMSGDPEQGCFPDGVVNAAPPAEGGTSIVDGAPWPEREALRSSDSNRPAVPLPRRWRRVGITVASALGLLLIAAIGWYSDLPRRIDATGSVPRLSIVVLPFTNLSGDPKQQYFADGITEDLTTDLSRIPNMFVIARNTAFTYRDNPVSARQIGRELGVRYVLEGSVRRSGSQVRVDAQLIDAETDAHLWAERFDDDTSDLFALQNQITSRIARATDSELVAAEVARPTLNPDALDYLLRGRAAFLKPSTISSLAEAIDWLERALALDPQSAHVQSVLANVYASRVMSGMTHTPAADIARAEELIAQAFAATPRSPYVHFAKGNIFRAQVRCEEAIPEYETVLSANPNSVSALADIGRCKIYLGKLDEAITLIEQAIRLSPRDPSIGNFYFRIGEARLLQSRTDDAIVWLEKSCNANPAFASAHAHLAAAYGLRGETTRAARELAEARKLAVDDRYSSMARLRRSWGPTVTQLAPEVRALYQATYLAGLRKAGMPEE
jgi:adenylate cyclase